MPDPRLDEIAKIVKPAQIVPARIGFVDIAGLVRGASKGEGLGNQFLANIREVDAIVHVLRCFEDDDITHVEGRVDPVADAETVEHRADARRSRQPRDAASSRSASERPAGDKEAKAEVALMDRSGRALPPASRRGWPTSRMARSARSSGLNLLTAKPVLYVANVEEAAAATGNRHSERVEALAEAEGARAIVISAAIEAEVAVTSRRGRARVPGEPRPRRAGPRPADPRRLRSPRPDHLLHRRPEGSARLDHHARHQGPAGGRHHPHRFRARLHSRPDHRL